MFKILPSLVLLAIVSNFLTKVGSSLLSSYLRRFPKKYSNPKEIVPKIIKYLLLIKYK